jgi:ATP-dependent DNA helicase RecQ
MMVRQNTEQITSDLDFILREDFGFDQFLPGQREVIQTLVAGRSAAAVFPTGGGKSICYQLPSVVFSGVTLVVSPLIALMKDQIDALTQKGIAAVRFDSTLTQDEYRSAMDRLRSRELRLVYVAPERFNNERFRGLLEELPISLFAVDEAHCISEWGHAFRPDYLKLARAAVDCGAERTLALTATATPQVLEDIRREFRIDPDAAITTGFYRPNLTLRTTAVGRSERAETLVARIQSRPPAATIVYVTLQKTAVEVADVLKAAGLPAKPYHAGMKPELRAETQDWFLNSDQAIIVATIAFGMGIDKSDIRYVYHYNLAKSLESYSQEIGRAGRDGLESICESLVCTDDLRALENFAYGDTPTYDSLLSFLRDLFAQPEKFAVSIYDLQNRHDIRDLVLKTLLTYLELDGYLQGGTPIYGEYRFKPLVSSAEILDQFVDERREFVASLLKQSRQARTWFHLDIDAAVANLNTERNRVVKAMDFLAERGWLELKASKVQHSFRQQKQPKDIAALAADLHERCLARQERELARLQQLLSLMALDGCQTNALAAHFGENRAAACGHCNWCLEEQPIALETSTDSAIDAAVWQRAIEFRSQHEPSCLDVPTTFARFLCGVRSPSLSKAKMTGERLFGQLAECSFATVLAKATAEE